MTNAAASIDPTLTGAQVYTTTGQYLGTVQTVAGPSFLVASAATPAGVWLAAERIQLVARRRIYLRQ
jgi:hypothetical protein